MNTNIIVAVISVIGSVAVAIISYSASIRGVKEAAAENAKLIAYRLEQLEIKQNKHNSMIERMYKLEGEMTEVQHDIRDLKGAKS